VALKQTRGQKGQDDQEGVAGAGGGGQGSCATRTRVCVPCVCERSLRLLLPLLIYRRDVGVFN